MTPGREVKGIAGGACRTWGSEAAIAGTGPAAAGGFGAL